MRYTDTDKLIKDLNDLSEHYTDKGKEYHPHIDFVLEVIDKQQTADVRENVRGTWKIYCDEKGVVEDCYCDQCGFNSVIGGNFCPNCGADMRGGDA